MPSAAPPAAPAPAPPQAPAPAPAQAQAQAQAQAPALAPAAGPAAPTGAALRDAAAGNPPAAALRATPGGGTPDAGATLGHDVATPPSLPASAPRLNLDLVRPRGGAISAQGSRGLLPLLPHPPEAKSKLADDIEKAARADCRKAYGSLGLAAVLPLAIDAVRDKGCKW